VYTTFETTKIAKLMTTVRQFNDKLEGYEVSDAMVTAGWQHFTHIRISLLLLLLQQLA
jgi:hypothetical protein